MRSLGSNGLAGNQRDRGRCRRRCLARTPRLEPGEFGLVDLAAVDEAGVGSVVTDPADGTYDGMWSFRNTGPVAITVRVAQRCRATTRSPTEPVRG